MIVRELLSDIRNTLQDFEKNYWDDSELLSYYNEALKNLASERTEIKETSIFPLTSTENTYKLNGVLRYISAKDDENNTRTLYLDDTTGDDDDYGIIVKNYNELYVNDPTIGVNIYLTYIGMPTEQNSEDRVRTGDEMAIKYFVLSRAYEKETDTENFNKATYFNGKYKEQIPKLRSSSSLNYVKNQTLTKSYFY